MSKTYSVDTAIGFLRGWIAARGAQDPFVEALEVIISAATSPVNVDVVPNEEVKRQLDEAEATIKAYKKEIERLHLSRSIKGNPQPLPKIETESQKKKEIEIKVSKDTVIEAIHSNYRDNRLLPQTHEQQVHCYQCAHYHAVPGERLRHCEKYDIDIHRGLAKRECTGFQRLPLDARMTPKMYCVQCKAYDKLKEFCRVLSIPVAPSANRYRQCPFHTLKQAKPLMQHLGSNKVKYDEQNKKEGKN